MKTSIIDRCNKFKEFLLDVPRIVDLFEKKDLSALQHWKIWLHNTEKFLKENKFPEVSQIASLRANILKVQMQSAISKDKRKILFEAAIATIDPAQNIVYQIYAKSNSALEPIYALFRQILIPMRVSNLISLNGGTDLSFVNDLIRQLSLNEKLASNINGAIASIGKSDVVRVILEILTDEI